jgi:hypothetical protein
MTKKAVDDAERAKRAAEQEIKEQENAIRLAKLKADEELEATRQETLRKKLEKARFVIFSPNNVLHFFVCQERLEQEQQEAERKRLALLQEQQVCHSWGRANFIRRHFAIIHPNR